MGGYAARVMAALKKYDLIYENKGVIKLTEDAVDLALHEPDSAEYADVVKKLAMKPSIYEKILEDNNGCIPSDAALRVKLVKDYKFNPVSVNDFISTFRRTMEFAGLTGDITVQKQESANADIKLPAIGIQASASQKQLNEKNFTMAGTVFPIPLSKRKQAAIAFESLPVEKKDIEAIKKWLELFEDSLTESEDIEQ